MIDITAQESLQRKKLEEKFKNVLVSSLSHSLKSPLNVLQLNNQLLQRVATPFPELMAIAKQDQLAQQLMAYQVEDMLEFSRCETGEDCQLNWKQFETVNLFEEMRDMFEPLCKAKNLGFTMSISKDIPKQCI